MVKHASKQTEASQSEALKAAAKAAGADEGEKAWEGRLKAVVTPATKLVKKGKIVP